MYILRQRGSLPVVIFLANHKCFALQVFQASFSSHPANEKTNQKLDQRTPMQLESLDIIGRRWF